MEKNIEGYGGRFSVTDDGRVFSSERLVNNYTGLIHKPKRELRQHKDAKGYPRVYLDENGKTRFVSVHRLVALTFIPNPENKPQVNHIDGNKENNHIENLEWVTNLENQRHARKMGLAYTPKTAGKPPRPVEQYDLVTGEAVATYESIADATRKTGAKNIGMCCRGLRKQAKGYGWKYSERKVM